MTTTLLVLLAILSPPLAVAGLFALMWYAAAVVAAVRMVLR